MSAVACQCGMEHKATSSQAGTQAVKSRRPSNIWHELEQGLCTAPTPTGLCGHETLHAAPFCPAHTIWVCDYVQYGPDALRCDADALPGDSRCGEHQEDR